MRDVIFAFLLSALPLVGAEFHWLPSPATNVASYRLSVGSQPGQYTRAFQFWPTNWTVLGGTNRVTIENTNLPYGRFHGSMTALLPDGTESVPSNEATATNRAFAPVLIFEGSSALGSNARWGEIARFETPPMPLDSAAMFTRVRLESRIIP